MQCKTVVLWSVINGKPHEQLKESDQTIEALMPLIEALFPGINYYSISGFGQVMNRLVTPILKKRYPEMLTTPAGKIRPTARKKITVVLPSNGYEWDDSSRWESKFNKLLAAK